MKTVNVTSKDGVKIQKILNAERKGETPELMQREHKKNIDTCYSHRVQLVYSAHIPFIHNAHAFYTYTYVYISPLETDDCDDNFPPATTNKKETF